MRVDCNETDCAVFPFQFLTDFKLSFLTINQIYSKKTVYGLETYPVLSSCFFSMKEHGELYEQGRRVRRKFSC